MHQMFYKREKKFVGFSFYLLHLNKVPVVLESRRIMGHFCNRQKKGGLYVMRKNVYTYTYIYKYSS